MKSDMSGYPLPDVTKGEIDQFWSKITIFCRVFLPLIRPLMLSHPKSTFFWIFTQNAFSLIFSTSDYFEVIWNVYLYIALEFCFRKDQKGAFLRLWSRFFISWIVIRPNHNGINTPKLFNFTFHYYIYEYQYLVNFNEFGIKRSISQLFYK